MEETRKKFWVYVIELGSSAEEDPKFDHPRRDRSKPCLYVGSTAKEIAERYDDHITGAWTQSRAVRRHGCTDLRHDLARKRYALSREKAEQLECQLAESLRRQGFGVSQS